MPKNWFASLTVLSLKSRHCERSELAQAAWWEIVCGVPGRKKYLWKLRAPFMIIHILWESWRAAGRSCILWTRREGFPLTVRGQKPLPKPRERRAPNLNWGLLEYFCLKYCMNRRRNGAKSPVDDRMYYTLKFAVREFPKIFGTPTAAFNRYLIT